MKWIDKIVDAIRLDEEWNVDEKQRLTDEEIINVNDETGTAEYRIAAYYEQEGDENEYVVAYPVEEKLLLSKIALLKVCEAETDLEKYCPVNNDRLKTEIVHRLTNHQYEQFVKAEKQRWHTAVGWTLFALVTLLIIFFDKINDNNSWSLSLPSIRDDIIISVFTVSTCICARVGNNQGVAACALTNVVSALQYLAIIVLTAPYRFGVTVVWTALFLFALLLSERRSRVSVFTMIGQIVYIAVSFGYMAYHKIAAKDIATTAVTDKFTLLCMAVTVLICGIVIAKRRNS